MKYIRRNTLVAAAALSACGLAAAQSSVQMFGVVDAAIQRGTGSVASKTQLGSSGLTTSRFGVRGREDLGDGLWAGYWLEAGVNVDSGTGVATNTNNQASGASTGQGLAFNRRSTVSLGGNWGEVRLGRDFTPQYNNLAYEPTGNVGVGTSVNYTNIITGPTNTRASNAVSYFTPRLNGFSGQAQYYLGENQSNSANKDDGNGWGVRAVYNGGPFELGVATSRTKYLGGNSQQSNIGGYYDFGMAKVLANYSHDEGLVAPGTSSVKANGWSLGTTVPLGAEELRAGYSTYKIDQQTAMLNDPRAKKFMLGWVHNFSKRTAAYTTVARLNNSGGSSSSLLGAVASANGHSNGYEAGLRHSF